MLLPRRACVVFLCKNTVRTCADINNLCAAAATSVLCFTHTFQLHQQLSHNRKALLKYLLRIIALSSYSPTGNVAATRPQDEDAQLLFASLKVCIDGVVLVTR